MSQEAQILPSEEREFAQIDDPETRENLETWASTLDEIAALPETVQEEVAHTSIGKFSGPQDSVGWHP